MIRKEEEKETFNLGLGNRAMRNFTASSRSAKVLFDPNSIKS